jgi:hypothetical protein
MLGEQIKKSELDVPEDDEVIKSLKKLIPAGKIERVPAATEGPPSAGE